uniref:Embryo surrounding factor 1 brassicaceae domain-containing protein n=1 Tax=Daucus carota subsp. sativus TaxID=79200 RepID=A0A175YNT1_DAUCS
MESKKSALMLLLALFVISAMIAAPVAEARELTSTHADDKNLSNILLAYGRDQLFKNAFQLEGLSTSCIGYFCLYTSCCAGCQCVTSYADVPIPAYCETSCKDST